MVYNLCGAILNSGDTELAEKVMMQYYDLLPDNLIQELSFLIEEKRLDSVVKGGYSPEAVLRISDALDRGIITSKRAEEMLVFLYAKES